MCDDIYAFPFRGLRVLYISVVIQYLIFTALWFGILDANSMFGLPLSEQFQISDGASAPPFVVWCTTELERRTRETGSLTSVHTTLLSAADPVCSSCWYPAFWHLCLVLEDIDCNYTLKSQYLTVKVASQSIFC